MEQIFLNSYLLIPIAVMLLAQATKVMYFSIKEKKLDFIKILSTGGMPSSHSAFVSSLATIIGCNIGVASSQFAIAVVLAMIVVHDASGIRQAARKTCTSFK